MSASRHIITALTEAPTIWLPRELITALLLLPLKTHTPEPLSVDVNNLASFFGAERKKKEMEEGQSAPPRAHS